MQNVYYNLISMCRVPDAEMYSPVLMLPTSGSTGMPKAALYNGQALVSTLPVQWSVSGSYWISM